MVTVRLEPCVQQLVYFTVLFNSHVYHFSYKKISISIFLLIDFVHYLGQYNNDMLCVYTRGVVYASLLNEAS